MALCGTCVVSVGKIGKNCTPNSHSLKVCSQTILGAYFTYIKISRPTCDEQARRHSSCVVHKQRTYRASNLSVEISTSCSRKMVFGGKKPDMVAHGSTDQARAPQMCQAIKATAIPLLHRLAPFQSQQSILLPPLRTKRTLQPSQIPFPSPKHSTNPYLVKRSHRLIRTPNLHLIKERRRAIAPISRTLRYRAKEKKTRQHPNLPKKLNLQICCCTSKTRRTSCFPHLRTQLTHHRSYRR